jgi:hypothetical protein
MAASMALKSLTNRINQDYCLMQRIDLPNNLPEGKITILSLNSADDMGLYTLKYGITHWVLNTKLE